MKSKRTITAMIFIMCILGITPASAGLTLDAPITKVTVFPQRAMITRSATINLPAGDTTLFIENLPYGADGNSFRASVHGAEAALLGLNHRIVRHTEAPQKKIAEMEREIYQVEKYEKQAVLDRKEVFQQQKKLLLSIGQTSGEKMSEQLDGGKMDISQWRNAFDFMGEALRAVNDSISAVNRELDQVDVKLSTLKEVRQSLSGQASRQSKTVEIELRMTGAGQVAIDLDYVIGGVSWRPLYDARLDDEKQKIDFDCYAEVGQTTGEDWSDVDLILSTFEPTKETGPGSLIPWILSLNAPVMGRVHTVTGQRKGIDFNQTGTVSIKTQNVIEVAPVATVDDLLARETGITYDPEGELNISGNRAGEVAYLIASSTYGTTFNVTRKVTIPSGDDASRVPLGNHSLDSKITYMCRAKNRQAAYRLAKITNQPDTPLLPGPVSIFAGSNYLGKTFIDRFVTPGEEFDLPFGEDSYIEVERKLIKNKAERKGDKIRRDQTVKIVLTNHNSESRVLSVEESLPVSEDGRLKVKLREMKPDTDEDDKKDKTKAVWTIMLDPGEQQEIILSYRIEYPSTMQLAGF